MKLIRPYLFPPDLVFVSVCVCILLKALTALCFESPLFILLNHLLISRKQPLAEQITQCGNSKQSISVSLAARFNVVLWDKLPVPCCALPRLATNHDI